MKQAQSSTDSIKILTGLLKGRLKRDRTAQYNLLHLRATAMSYAELVDDYEELIVHPSRNSTDASQAARLDHLCPLIAEQLVYMERIINDIKAFVI